MSDEVTTQLEAGSATLHGPRQIFIPQPIPLASNSGAGEATVATTVMVPVPSSQCRIKGSIVFFPSSGVLPDISGFGSVWVSGCDEDYKGAAGSGGRIMPVTDVEGTQATPLVIPEKAGLAGYSREFVTAADWLQFVITLSSNATPGQWMFQAKIQPEGVIFGWEAWAQIRALFQPQLIGPKGNL